MKDESKWWEKTNICAPSSQGDFDLVKQIAELKKEVEELKAQLARAKEDHQYDNLVHQQELESLKNPIQNLRKKGLM
jgi:predicted RNase H-like nuclease (RuvC/YqgF family)